jgi:SNF2 family DNA or RNA helicase
MGLGKTIQTLALILSHLKTVDRSIPKDCKSTLLVVPLALADQWRREVKEKTTLKAHVHHGPKRELDPARLARYDVVITTYDTVSSEYLSNRALFHVDWWRVVLGNSPILF